ncbi:unnamed protein product, partial [Prorocentrum cordatum]
MSVVRLEEDDLDDEDRAILAEVRKKGYYHGRPKSEACAMPAKIEVAAAPSHAAGSQKAQSRARFDDFQAKWDRFDNDAYLGQLEAATEAAAEAAAPSRSTPSAASGGGRGRPQRPLATQPAAEFKLLVLGDGGVGKTALVRRHTTGEFVARWCPTGAAEVSALRFWTSCGEVRLNAWDLGCAAASKTAATQPCWRQGCVRERDLSQGECAIIMFDTMSRQSYKSLPSWHREVSRACGPVPTAVVGNKADARERHMKPEDVTFPKSRGLPLFSMSVRTGLNVERPFLWLLRRLTASPSCVSSGLARKPRRTPWTRRCSSSTPGRSGMPSRHPSTWRAPASDASPRTAAPDSPEAHALRPEAARHPRSHHLLHHPRQFSHAPASSSSSSSSSSS